MPYTSVLKKFLTFFVACVLVVMVLDAHAAPLEMGENTEIQTQLKKINAEEKRILEELFQLSSEIMLSETAVKSVQRDIQNYGAVSHDIEESILEETRSYETLKANLGELLKNQQRSGIASGMTMVLEAENIKDLIRRINLLRELSKNTSDLISQLDASKLVLMKEQQELESMIQSLKGKEEELQAIQNKQIAVRRELEAYLASLKDEQASYQAYLASFEDLFIQAKAVTSETVERMTTLINTGALPEDTVEITPLLFAAKGTIREDKFNAILSTQENLNTLAFGFETDGVTLSFDAYELYIEGRFTLVDDQTIKYVVDQGTLYGFPLGASALKELFSEGDLVFSFKELLGDNRIKKIDHYDGLIELLIEGSLF